MPGVPEFKGVKKPSKLESGKKPEELAKKLGIKTHEEDWEDKIAKAKEKIKLADELEGIELADEDLEKVK